MPTVCASVPGELEQATRLCGEGRVAARTRVLGREASSTVDREAAGTAVEIWHGGPFVETCESAKVRPPPRLVRQRPLRYGEAPTPLVTVVETTPMIPTSGRLSGLNQGCTVSCETRSARASSTPIEAKLSEWRDGSARRAAPRSGPRRPVPPEALRQEPPASRGEQAANGDQYAGQDRDGALGSALGELEIGHRREERDQRRRGEHPDDQREAPEPQAEPSAAGHPSARAAVDTFGHRAQAERYGERGEAAVSALSALGRL